MRQKKFDKILQFKVTLEGISPPVWRRIQVPDCYTFWDLHVAIQDAMGWHDCHLHRFEVFFPETNVTLEIGIPMPEEEGIDSDDGLLPGWKEGVAVCLKEGKPIIAYLYDFGDNWKHLVEFEGVFPRDSSRKYPACLDGARACPPDDSGGAYGYLELLEIAADRTHEEHEDTVAWLGRGFDPERFDPSKVRFDNPTTRWKRAFEE